MKDYANRNNSDVTDSGYRHQLLTMPEVAERLRVSRWMVFRLVQRNELKTLKIGSRRLISSVDFNDYINHRRGQDPWQ